MSFFDKKETKPELQYNYYNILTKKITENELSFIGKPNNPNLIITNGSHDTKYTSSKLYLFSKTKSISSKYIDKNSLFGFGSGITSDFDAELVVENNSISNSKSNNKVLLCFLLKTNAKSNSNLIDTVMESKINTNLEIELNDIVPQNDEYIYHEPNTEFGPKLEDATIIIFKNPILCKSNFEILQKITNPFFSNAYVENMIGQMNPNIIEGLDNSSPTTDSSGNILINNGDFLECSVADIDGNDISTYDVAINQQVPKNYITQFTTATYFISVFLVIAVSYLCTPAIYSFIMRFFNIQDPMEIFKKIFMTEWGIVSITFWITFILFFIGIGLLNNNTTKDNTIGYGFIGTSINIFIFLIINIVIIQFKKSVEPTFTGLKYKEFKDGTGSDKQFDFNTGINETFKTDKFVSNNPLRVFTTLFGFIYMFGVGPFSQQNPWDSYTNTLPRAP